MGIVSSSLRHGCLIETALDPGLNPGGTNLVWGSTPQASAWIVNPVRTGRSFEARWCPQAWRSTRPLSAPSYKHNTIGERSSTVRGARWKRDGAHGHDVRLVRSPPCTAGRKDKDAGPSPQRMPVRARRGVPSRLGGTETRLILSQEITGSTPVGDTNTHIPG